MELQGELRGGDLPQLDEAALKNATLSGYRAARVADSNGMAEAMPFQGSPLNDVIRGSSGPSATLVISGCGKLKGSPLAHLTVS
jgi:hypothetical protein